MKKVALNASYRSTLELRTEAKIQNYQLVEFKEFLQSLRNKQT